MRKLTAIILLFIAYSCALGQEDFIPTEKIHSAKWGIGAGLFINAIKPPGSKYYPVTPFYGQNFTGELYRNAFHNALVTPFLEFSYKTNKNFFHSMDIGYVYVVRSKDGSPPYIYPTDGISFGFFRSIIIDYAFNSFLLEEMDKKINPYIGIKTNYSLKTIADSVKHITYKPDAVIDKSQLFNLQALFGLTFHKANFYISICQGINLFTIIQGHQIFSEGSPRSPSLNTDTDYSKTFFLTNKFIFSTTEIKTIYYF